MRNIICDEKTAIIYRKWRNNPGKIVLLLVHGLGGHSQRWGFLADFFLSNNISSYALELKGFGQTDTPKGHIDSFDTYFKDIKSLHAVIRGENPGSKVFIIGESLGALISFIITVKSPGLFFGIICISPAFKSRMPFSLWDYLNVFSFQYFFPLKSMRLPFSSGICTRDTEYIKQMDSDERECRIASVRLLFNIIMAQIEAVFIKSKLKTPLLFLIAGEDKLVDDKASVSFFNRLTLKDKKMIQYPKMYHALSIDLEREKVFQDILGWLNTQSGKQG